MHKVYILTGPMQMLVITGLYRRCKIYEKMFYFKFFGFVASEGKLSLKFRIKLYRKWSFSGSH